MSSYFFFENIQKLKIEKYSSCQHNTTAQQHYITMSSVSVVVETVVVPMLVLLLVCAFLFLMFKNRQTLQQTSAPNIQNGRVQLHVSTHMSTQ